MTVFGAKLVWQFIPLFGTKLASLFGIRFGPEFGREFGRE